jgi:hypothetical protein
MFFQDVVRAGEIAYIAPGAVHFGINVGFTCSTTINCVSSSWAKTFPKNLRTASEPMWDEVPDLNVEKSARSCKRICQDGFENISSSIHWPTESGIVITNFNLILNAKSGFGYLFAEFKDFFNNQQQLAKSSVSVFAPYR